VTADELASKTEPKPCQHCGRVDGHTTICWAVGKGADNISVATGSSGGVPDQGALDRAEDRYLNTMIGE